MAPGHLQVLGSGEHLIEREWKGRRKCSRERDGEIGRSEGGEERRSC